MMVRDRSVRELVREADVAILVVMFFAGVMAVATWAIVATIAPRLDYIAALLSDRPVSPMLVPVAQRRRVRRLSPLSFRSEVRLIRAAA